MIVGNTLPTLADWAKRMDPQGNTSTIVEMLTKQQPILQDAVAVEGNLPTGHRTTVRSGLPAVAWRLLNYGVQPSKSQTKQVDDTCGMLEAYAEVDKSLADLNGNSASWRLSEEAPFTEAMGQEAAFTSVYGNTAQSPEKFLGLAPRYNTVNMANAESARNVIDAGGTGNANTSIWFVTWSDQTTHLTFPKGQKAGLQMNDKGQVTIENANGVIGARMEAYRTHYKWDLGLTVRDWRYNSRIANIDVAALMNAGNANYTGPNLINLLIDGYTALQSLGKGRTVIYANRTIIGALDKLALNKSNLALSMGEWGGEQVTMFRGMPIRLLDTVLNTESRVV